MTSYLLDVNVLVALAWPEHVHHSLVRSWFSQNRVKGWATCPMVQTGFVRLLSNPAFSINAVSTKEAITALRTSTSDDCHTFFSDSLSVADAIKLANIPVRGHKQVNDAYLVGLAIHYKSRLATLDRGIALNAIEGSTQIIA